MADRRLQVFHTVARLLSFTKAAEALHMTQPAVTFQIRQLEEYFNTRLFDRTHNRISLTETGELVFGYADRIINLYNEMDNEVRKLTGDVIGVLVVGASTTIAEYRIPTLLGNFQRQYPDVKLRLKVSNTVGIVHMVENNEVDLGIVEAPVHNKNLILRVCWEDQLMVVCPPSHDLTKRGSANVESLLEYPFICREEGSGTRDVVEGYLKDHDLNLNDLNLTMEFGSPESIKAAVEAGLGITIISESTLGKELKLGTLSAVPLDPPMTRPFTIVYQRQKFRLRAMEEFLMFAEQRCDHKLSQSPG
ncbi:MAG: selenium metabolism-associated LysR family transcriptional regulator [Gammaproteobacteria bacterium]|nr:selenium metabolism-associated LysR family transcriptional regulator [Gammaproteobacteria bacterium]